MVRPPLALYVAWHPEYAAGKAIAARLYRHFGAGHGGETGMGMPVFYRSVPAPRSGRPLPVDWHDADATAVVILADGALARDGAWAEYAQSLAKEVEGIGLGARVFPVTVEEGGADVCPGIEEMRWHQWAGGENKRRQKLLRNLTHELIRMLRHRLEQTKRGDSVNLGDYLKKLSIFLSHSKSDGEGVAAAVRDWLYENSALSSFFDVRDVPPGLPFSDVIDRSIEDGVVVIYTDSYSSREWCRRESTAAKLKSVPMLVMDCLQNVDRRSFPYLGNVPVIRMDRPDDSRIPEAVGLLLDEMLRDLLWRCAVTSLRGAFPQVEFMARPPELISLAALQDANARQVVYPDPPLGTEELELFSKIDDGLRLLSLKQWQAEAEA